MSDQGPLASLVAYQQEVVYGYEVAQRIRSQPWGSKMTLIAVTGWGQEDDKRKAKEAGFDHHLTKPIDPNALERLMSPPAHA